MFLAEPETLARTLATAVIAYVALVLMLRVSGKRTLAKWNAFDLIVTVALGSSVATVILSPTPLAEGLLAFAALILLQLVVTWIAVRLPAAERLIKAAPVYLLRDGRLDEQALRRERVTASEVRAAVRSRGIGRLEEVAAVVLETSGDISVVPRKDGGPLSALLDVRSIGPGR